MPPFSPAHNVPLINPVLSEYSHDDKLRGGGVQLYLEPFVCLALSNLAQEISAGLADAACCRQHSLSGLQTHTENPSGCETATVKPVKCFTVVLSVQYTEIIMDKA